MSRIFIAPAINTAPWADRFMPRAEAICGHKMRDGVCNMHADHRGRHTTQAWECDGCGKMRRGTPSAKHPEAGWFCFMCAGEPFRYW